LRSKKVYYDGILFDSGIEMRRYQELCLLQAAGYISDLTTQPPFVLCEKFTDKWGGKQRRVVYHADFAYVEDGHRVVEEIKPTNRRRWSRDFLVRWAWVKVLHPEIEFRIVTM